MDPAFARELALRTISWSGRLLNEVGGADTNLLLDRYLQVDERHRIPPTLASGVLGFFRGRAEGVRRYAEAVLGDQQ